MKSREYMYQKGFDTVLRVLIQACQHVYGSIKTPEYQNCIKTGFDTLNYMIPLYLQALSKLTWRLS